MNGSSRQHAHSALHSGPGIAHGTAAAPRPALRDFVLAGLASLTGHDADPERSATSPVAEVRYLTERQALVARGTDPWYARLDTCLASPAESDVPLLILSREMGLSLAELLSAALAAAVEDDLMAGRALAYVQSPVGGSRPTLGLLATLLGPLPACAHAIEAIATGAGQRTGMIAIQGEGPLPERTVCLPSPIALGLRGFDANWPGVSIDDGLTPEVPLPASTVEVAARQARALSAAPMSTLVLRSGSVVEARAVARAIAARLQRRAAFIDTDHAIGLGPWLFLRGLVPVFSLELAPGEHRRLPDIPGYRGPVLVVCGPEGTVERRGESTSSWRLPTPDPSERAALWARILGDPTLAENLACDHRHSAGRIAELARSARQLSRLDDRQGLERADLVRAARVAEAPGLGALAQPMPDAVTDDVLVVPEALRSDLHALAARCRGRDTLADTLGPAARARYHPGVRALFVGPSGTGKTLAASWLATTLGVPLYRVDLAAVTSKYIGETEKHLAQLIARAEHAEIALLFDEADSLFGKRTDVKDSNDRFANAQTNYLLQRIETFDGIAILTSNSRARFDSAFSRRLDAILDFPAPGPEERRRLWTGHLGPHHTLSTSEVNQLAATVDLAGGHIRNIVFAAAAAARTVGRAIESGDLIRAVAAEYRKLGRQAPAALGGSRN